MFQNEKKPFIYLVTDALLNPIVRCDENSTDTTCLLKRINDLNKRLSAMETHPALSCPAVAFLAYFKSPPTVTANTQLRFDNVQLNVGGAYQPFHGNVLAPVNGIYFFTYTITSNPNKLIRVRIVKNGANIGQILHAPLANYLQTTESIIIQLNKGDDVWLVIRDTNTAVITPASESHFSGILLQCLV